MKRTLWVILALVNAMLTASVKARLTRTTANKLDEYLSVRFHKNEAGQVSQVVIHQNGDTVAKRL